MSKDFKSVLELRTEVRERVRKGWMEGGKGEWEGGREEGRLYFVVAMLDLVFW